MKKLFKLLFLPILIWGSAENIVAQITQRPRPEAWKQLVEGAAFKDRFLPMPSGKLGHDSWGGKNVLPRYINNGIEDSIRSYWGGNILKGKDGLYHLFVCAWPENSAKGHHQWPNSIVYHTVSKNSYGSFSIKDTIGPGHNPEVLRLKNGRLVLYVIGKNYTSNDINGPWAKGHFDFDPRDRPVIDGLSNLTFAQREDGSYLMVCRGGGVWISQTGVSPYKKISNKSAYPPIEGRFEDPVVWRDHVQYNLIVNDWLGRIAYYLRSKDGVHWVTDAGEAYTPGIAHHQHGKVEDWFKFERMKVYQDKYGRAVQANFAVIDTLKNLDKGNDEHSSKNIAIPLNPGVLIEMLTQELPTAKKPSMKIKILAENGFNPQKDIDIKSLRFGASAEVNFGRGAKVLSTEKSGKNLIVTFSAEKSGLTKSIFAPKLIGKYTSGKILYGYTRVPWVEYDGAILSARKPIFKSSGDKLAMSIPVGNFGLAASRVSKLEISYTIDNRQRILAVGDIPIIKEYGKYNVGIAVPNQFEKGKEYRFSISIYTDGIKRSVYNFKAMVEK